MREAYGSMIRLNRADGSADEVLPRIPLGAPANDGGIDESTLQDLLFRFPKALPIADIDEAYAGLIPVCKELSTPAGYLDAFYVNTAGRMTIVEFKLWRNPQARREVIGQILDYAKELASWSYEDLQREVSKALNRTGNVLYELARNRDPEVEESAFVDNVTRHLRRGEFLLLIVGDGIREGVRNIVDFVQRHSGLHFNLALVEAALFRDTHDRVIVQPRILASTEIVQRVVYETGETSDVGPGEAETDDVLSDLERENLRFWTAVLENYSFADVTVEIPNATKEPVLYFKVKGSGHGGWGLSFAAYLYRKTPSIGCYLTYRRGVPHVIRIYEQIEAGLDELRAEMGDDLLSWTDSGDRPRMGYFRQGQGNVPFGEAEDSDEFQDAARWMQEKLNLLVSNLHPRLQELLSSNE